MSVKRIDCCVETKPCVKPFPKLMIGSSGNIAIWFDRHYCTVLYSVNLANPGKYYCNGDITSWRDYNEPLTLQNE